MHMVVTCNFSSEYTSLRDALQGLIIGSWRREPQVSRERQAHELALHLARELGGQRLHLELRPLQVETPQLRELAERARDAATQPVAQREQAEARVQRE